MNVEKFPLGYAAVLLWERGRVFIYPSLPGFRGRQAFPRSSLHDFLAYRTCSVTR